MYPFITVFNKSFSSYGILMCIGVVLVFFLAYRNSRKNNILIDDLFIVSSFALLFGLIGAGFLNAIITYPISTIIKSIMEGRFEIFSGLVFYGGLIGGIVGGILGIKVAKINTQLVERSVVPFLPIGHAIGRIGCLLAGCCTGKEYDGIFAIHYPSTVSELSAEQGYFPVQLLEAGINIIISITLIIYSKKQKPKYSILFLYLLLYSVMRFCLEFLRGDEIRGIYFGLSTSQCISILLLLVSFVYFSASYFKTKK